MEINKNSKTYQYYEKLLSETPHTFEELKTIAINKLVQKELEILRIKEIVYLLQKHKSDLFFKEETNALNGQDIYVYLLCDKKLYVNIPTSIFEKNYMSAFDENLEKIKRKQDAEEFKNYVEATVSKSEMNNATVKDLDNEIELADNANIINDLEQ